MGSKYLVFWNSYFLLLNDYSIYGLCLTFWTNEFLGSYSNYKFIISFSIFNRMVLWRILCLQSNIEEVLSLSFFFNLFLSFLWIGAQFPQEKFLSYGRILTLDYYFLLMCILFHSFHYLIHIFEINGKENESQLMKRLLARIY